MPPRPLDYKRKSPIKGDTPTEMQELARKYAGRAMRTIGDACKPGSKITAVQLNAAKEILERAFGASGPGPGRPPNAPAPDPAAGNGEPERDTSHATRSLRDKLVSSIAAGAAAADFTTDGSA